MTITIPQTLAHVAADGAAHFGDRPAQRFKRDGTWQDLSYAELGSIVEEIACGLLGLGIQPGDRVCILADTRPEWVQVQFACAAAGAVVVPIYPSNSPQECEWVIGNSGAVAVFCEDAAQLLKVEQVRDALPCLKDVILIEPVPGRQGLDELRAAGRAGDRFEVRRRTGSITRDNPALIIYTSGTTGRPKGCVLTNRNLMSCVSAGIELDAIRADDICYLFLPLAHVFAQIVTIDVSSTGAVEGLILVATPAVVRDFSPQLGRASAMGFWTMGPVLGSLVVTAVVGRGTRT